MPPLLHMSEKEKPVMSLPIYDVNIPIEEVKLNKYLPAEASDLQTPPYVKFD